MPRVRLTARGWRLVAIFTLGGVCDAGPGRAAANGRATMPPSPPRRVRGRPEAEDAPA
jgi:hypothetical protein